MFDKEWEAEVKREIVAIVAQITSSEEKFSVQQEQQSPSANGNEPCGGDGSGPSRDGAGRDSDRRASCIAGRPSELYEEVSGSGLKGPPAQRDEVAGNGLKGPVAHEIF